MQIAAPLNSDAAPELQWIEVASSLQIPSFQIIGLPAPEVAEARERVKAAIEASELEFPHRRVVINLSPASIRKRGTGLDLGIALAVLAAELEKPPLPSPVAAWGELGLDGSVKPAGRLMRAVYSTWQAGIPLLLVSVAELESARAARAAIAASGLLTGAPPAIAGTARLRDAWDRIAAGAAAESSSGDVDEPHGWAPSEAPAAEAAGELLPMPGSLERALGATAAGAHHVLLLGPRGSGKSHALDWLIALQPPVDAPTRVRHALVEELSVPQGDPLARSCGRVPVRRVSPHARPASLVGHASGGVVRPGEFSLAHGGLLVADEFPEWSRDSREALREPLERGAVTLTRAEASLELPARFAFAANGNLCPCGGWPPQLPIPSDLAGDRLPRCRCTHTARDHYLARLSGPILDRMDLVLLVSPRRKPRKGSQAARRSWDSLARLRERVATTAETSSRQYGTVPGRLGAAALETLLAERASWGDWLDALPTLSLRARHKILRVALTLAAWDGTELAAAHLTEAAFYRPERYGLGG